MKISLIRLYNISLTVIFGMTVYLFFAFFYSGHLYYQEQFQFFLFDFFYFEERITTPGGLSEYIAEFLTQFYYHAWLGSIIITGLLLALQQLIWGISKRFNNAPSFYFITFIPSIFIWSFLCDENSMLAFLVSLLISILLTWLLGLIHSSKSRIIVSLLILPILYWCVGGSFFIFASLLACGEWYKSYQTKDTSPILFYIIILIVISLACPLIAQIWIQYPLINLFTGIGYYRFTAVFPYIIFITALLSILTPICFIFLPKNTRVIFIETMQFFIIGISSFFLINWSVDRNKEDAMCYDYLVKKQRWAEIIKKAEKKTPTSPFTVVCLNLALAKTDNLGERMFEFYQKGVEGLLPTFQRDFTSPLPASEAYYHLGMINTAQRFTFEAMEAIPNYRKSTRCYKRLAETNLINGQYEVAEKYIKALTRSLYYRKWANNALTYLNNEEKINDHPEWGKLRRYRYDKDFLYSPSELDIMLGLLIKRNQNNKMAFEYMLAHTLLNRNIDSFMKYYPLGKSMDYHKIPRSYQEALVFIWTQQNNSFDGMPWSISPQIKHSVSNFARIYTQQTNAEKLLKEKFGDTYWSYLLFKN